MASMGPIQIEHLKISHNKIKFLLKNCDVSVANALRRAIIAEVPTLAIEFVTIEENTSALHDEFLAHRLGLIPIRFIAENRDAKKTSILQAFNMHHDCHCDTGCCSDCSVIFKLDVVNRDIGPRIITSFDLSPVDKRPDVEIAHFCCPEEEAMASERDNGITIVKLGPGQSIHATCIATLGNGKMHAKWCPVGTATFQYEHSIRLNPVALEKMSAEKKRDFVAKTQPGLFAYDESTGVVSVLEGAGRRLVNMDDLTQVGQTCAPTTGDPVVFVAIIPGRYWFRVETNGALPPDQIVSCALEVLHTKLDKLHRAVTECAATSLGEAMGGAGGADAPGVGSRYL